MVGSILFAAAYKEADEEGTYMFSGFRRRGREMPGDIHDHSGWGSGGRSESWSSEHHGGGGESGGGGD